MSGQRDHLDGLISVAADLTGAEAGAVRSFADLLLAAPETGFRQRGRSGLNNDSSPLEVCLSVLKDLRLTRLVADPASTISDPIERRDASVNALARALAATGAGKLAPLCDATVGAIVPRDPDALRAYVEGVLWIGAALGVPGIALYVDCTRGSADTSWSSAGTWLSTILADATHARNAIAALRDRAVLMAAGVEGSEPANARAKLFWRIPQPLSLRELGIPAFDDDAIRRFLELSVGDRELPLQALVFSTSFLVANGMPFDAKVDVCAHCLAQTDWPALVDSATSEFGLASIDVARALDGGRAMPAFVGLNRNALGQLRLDLFLKPAQWYEA